MFTAASIIWQEFLMLYLISFFHHQELEMTEMQQKEAELASKPETVI